MSKAISERDEAIAVREQVLKDRETFDRLMEEARLVEAAEYRHDPDAVYQLLARFVQSPRSKDAGIAERFVRDALSTWTEAKKAGRGMSFDSAFSLQPRHGKTRTHDPRVAQNAALSVYMRSRPSGGDLPVKTACREVASEMRLRVDEVTKFYKQSSLVRMLRESLKQSGGAKAAREARAAGVRDDQELERFRKLAKSDTTQD